MTLADEELVQAAEKLARQAHIEQKRWNGDPYITHPERVAACFDIPILRAVAWLHDVIEDTDISLYTLRCRGFSEDVVAAVEALTKIDDEDYLRFILRVKRNELARRVKTRDIEDNLRDLEKGSLRDKYRLSVYILTET